MNKEAYDIIIIGCGSGGLSVGLFMVQAGFRVLMVSESDASIGGECLNDGCVPSKALVHVASIVQNAKKAETFGLTTSGEVNMQTVLAYVNSKQEIIRLHENAAWLRKQGADVALGMASFSGNNEITVNGKRYRGKKIVIATGSRPRKLLVPGVTHVPYYDNESIFSIPALPRRLLVIGGGPVGTEIAQVMTRLGAKVTVIQQAARLLPKEPENIAAILQKQLEDEGVRVLLNASPEHFSAATKAEIRLADGSLHTETFDSVFVAIGRQANIETLALNNAGIEVHEGKIISNQYLQTTNQNVFVCGDVAGGLLFSHAAEYHARILLNNFFSPVRKKLHYHHFSWVTFTDPEIASFGLSEQSLNKRGIAYEKLEQPFSQDDRAVVDSYQYGRLILLVKPKRWFRKQTILGGTMIAPKAGELIQELILATHTGLSINALFEKIYPYPVASRINQHTIIAYKQKSLTKAVKHLLKAAFTLFS